MNKVLIIDNYDSFVYNLLRYVEELGFSTHIARNDKITLDEIINEVKPSHIILSPGPGIPDNAGICVELIQKLGAKAPILGVCLGHQAIVRAYGGVVKKAKCPKHGKSSLVKHSGKGAFNNIKSPMKVGRYHSLIVSDKEIPDNIKITAWSNDSEVMALEHKLFPVWGVQFHPESILTPCGKKIIENFLSINNEV